MNDTIGERLREELERQTVILEGVETALLRIADSLEKLTEKE